jgi:hypothetical protein
VSKHSLYYLCLASKSKYMQLWTIKEGPLKKNGPIDFAQSWAIYTWKNPIRFMVKRKRGVASHFWTHKMHVKELIWLAQSQCYGKGERSWFEVVNGPSLRHKYLLFLKQTDIVPCELKNYNLPVWFDNEFSLRLHYMNWICGVG